MKQVESQLGFKSKEKQEVVHYDSPPKTKLNEDDEEVVEKLEKVRRSKE